MLFGCSLFRHTALFLIAVLRVLLVHVRTSHFPAWPPRTGNPPASPPPAAGPRLPRVGRASLPGVWTRRTRPRRLYRWGWGWSGLLDLLGGAVRFVLDLLRGPRGGVLALVHAPHGSVLGLLRATLHRPCGVFDALFDLVGHVPHASAPCRVDAIRVAHGPAPGCAVCRTSQSVLGSGHTGKGDGAVLSVFGTHIAAKTMPRFSPRRNKPGKVSPCGWDRPWPCGPWLAVRPDEAPYSHNERPTDSHAMMFLPTFAKSG